MNITVGIYSRSKISFILNGRFHFDGADFSGMQTVELSGTKISFNGKEYSSLYFSSIGNATFTLKEVTIGINFHWQQNEAQTFKGDLELIIEDSPHGYAGKYHPLITAINHIDIEDYLTSVISSEMSATSAIELLKAHAVISRSWLLATAQTNNSLPLHEQRTENSITRYYERDAHQHFLVCADDHCQRYQGITRQTTSAAQLATAQTHGEVLTYNGEICDARFHKCCGGRTEVFSTCWADESKPYLQSVADPYCDTQNNDILTTVLNDYDLKTRNFHDWKVEYTDQELSELIKQRSGIDFGTITEIMPIEFGQSGRIKRLKIIGTKATITVGKELEIRKWLSTNHLYSSWFTVSHQNGIFSLSGKGWGHGVGLCQIGAAVMANEGYDYKTILKHYFPKAEISKLSN